MKDLTDKINTDKKFTVEAYSYIKNELDRETSKPVRKRDFDRIEQYRKTEENQCLKNLLKKKPL
ncbi:MAG: hypothetical protein NC177_12465 [Ruminococcus flavefaciens]|nr:hypothetical protein [Ruminococcus flavefaciens]